MELMLEQLFMAFDDLFEVTDEELELAKPQIIDELNKVLTGPAAMAQIDEYLRQCDLLGYTPEQYSADLENSKLVTYDALMSIKEKYPDSEVKGEIVDMVYSMLETYYTLIALRLSNRDSANVGIELIHPDAKIPTYAHEGDQGADIYAVEDVTIEPHTFGNMVSTGLKLLIPYGYAVSIRPRSGMSRNTPLRISNSPATIDQQYRGEVKILFDNFSNEPVTIKAGERIAQFILEKNYRANYSQVDTVEPNTDRGEGGFGSSGN